MGKAAHGRTGTFTAIAGIFTALMVAFVFASPALAQERSYDIILELTKGNFSSDWSCSPKCDDFGGFHSLGEKDHFGLNTIYRGLKIPGMGPAAKPGHPISLKAVSAATDPDSTWALSGTVWTKNNPNTPLNCTGSLSDPVELPHIFSAPGNTASELKLYIGMAMTDTSSGATISAENVTGTNCQDSNGWHAFWPLSWSCPSPGACGTRVEDMFTAHVSIPLSTLRTMKVGRNHQWSDTFNQSRARWSPPSDCTAIDTFGPNNGHCSETFDWTWRLIIWRPG